jgi:hypothetical protein
MAGDGVFPRLEVQHEAADEEEEGEEEQQTEEDEAGLGPEPRPDEPDHKEADDGGLAPDEPDRKRPRGNPATIQRVRLRREEAGEGPDGGACGA